MFAHGDYQDKESNYDTKWVDFSTDKKKICNFIKNVSSTCGYDSDECYELVLRQVSGMFFGKDGFIVGQQVFTFFFQLNISNWNI